MNKELPKNWIELSLFQISNVSTGKVNANHSTHDGKYKFFTCALNQTLSPTYSFSGESLIVPGNGNVGYVFYYNGKFEAYQRTYVINDIKINPKYLFYHFKYFWKIRTRDNLYGSTIQYVKIGHFKDYIVQIPPLPEQNRIVSKLDQLFGQLELIKSSLNNIPQLLKDFRQQVLTQAVTGKLTEEWRNGKNLKDWELKTISDLITKIQAGKNFNCPSQPVSGENVGLVKISAVTWGKFDENETKTVFDNDKINPKLFINKGDFLISRANTLELVGSCLIVNSINHKIMLSDKIWRVFFIENEDKFYTNLFLKSRLGREEIESRASGNQEHMRNLSQKSFKEINISIPPEKEKQEIITRVEGLFLKADKIEMHYETLKEKIDTLPQTILHKAFKGELVPQLASDGDAKDLLEEIRALKEAGSKKLTALKRKTTRNYKVGEDRLGEVAESKEKF